MAMTLDFNVFNNMCVSGVRDTSQIIAASPLHVDEKLHLLFSYFEPITTPEAIVIAMKYLVDSLIEKALCEATNRFAMGRAINVLLCSFRKPRTGELSPIFWSVLEESLEKETNKDLQVHYENYKAYKSLAFSLAEALGTSARMYGRQKATEMAIILLGMIKDFFRMEDPLMWVHGGQILKQAGAYIEDAYAEKRDDKGLSDLDKVFDDIKDKGDEEKSKAPAYIRSMMVNMIELRSYNWGRSPVPGSNWQPRELSQEEKDLQFDLNYGTPALNPTFLNSLANLTPEEHQFLSFSGFVAEEPEPFIDAEIERDFEHFLMMTRKGVQ